MPWVSNKIPPAGAYIVTYGSKTLTFNVPDQTNITKYLVIILPTVILNTNNTVHEITWTYKFSDGSDSIDPKMLIAGLNITLENGANHANHLYGFGTSTLDQTSHVLTDQTILWSDVTQIETGIQDVFGNNVDIDFIKP